MATSYISLGIPDDAFASAERASTLAPRNPLVGGILAGICSRLGADTRTQQTLDKLPPNDVKAAGMILYHVLRSELDIAANWYEKAIQYRDPFALFLAAHSFTAPLRSSPRWPALARMMNLE